MRLYDTTPPTEDTENNEATPAQKLGFSAGMLFGLLGVVALEATIAWAILTALVGLTLTWLQVFGLLLIVNGLSNKLFAK